MYFNKITSPTNAEISKSGKCYYEQISGRKTRELPPDFSTRYPADFACNVTPYFSHITLRCN